MNIIIDELWITFKWNRLKDSGGYNGDIDFTEHLLELEENWQFQQTLVQNSSKQHDASSLVEPKVEEVDQESDTRRNLDKPAIPKESSTDLHPNINALQSENDQNQTSVLSEKHNTNGVRLEEQSPSNDPLEENEVIQRRLMRLRKKKRRKALSKSNGNGRVVASSGRNKKLREQKLQSQSDLSWNSATHVCDVCNETNFSTKHHYEKHVKVKHPGVKPYPCPKCEKRFNQLNTVEEHVRLVHHNIKYKCTECPKQFRSKMAFHAHLRKHSGNLYTCEFCGKGFGMQSTLRKHKITHTNESAHKCPICFKAFPGDTKLRKHLEWHDKPKKSLSCKFCGSSCKSKQALDEHMVRHGVNSQNSCTQCEKVFATSRRLAKHIMYVHSDRRFVCEICGQAFKQATGLKKHFHGDIGGKFPCSQCDKTFFNSGQLNIHMHMHTGKDNFICGICGKGFKHPATFKHHQISAHGTKKYVCDSCGKSFSTNSLLKLHKRCHSEDRPYVCHICGKGFKRADSLQIHSPVHTKERRYVCKICGKTYSYDRGLVDHMKKQHPKVKNYSTLPSNRLVPVPNHHNGKQEGYVQQGLAELQHPVLQAQLAAPVDLAKDYTQIGLNSKSYDGMQNGPAGALASQNTY